MHAYHYCLCLLAFIVVIINSRYIQRSIDNEENEESYLPNNYFMTRGYHPNLLNRYLRNMMAFDLLENEKYDDSIPFERRGKAITKGDPREFMG